MMNNHPIYLLAGRGNTPACARGGDKDENNIC